jgi:hypothetical protein
LTTESSVVKPEKYPNRGGKLIQMEVVSAGKAILGETDSKPCSRVNTGQSISKEIF